MNTTEVQGSDVIDSPAENAGDHPVCICNPPNPTQPIDFETMWGESRKDFEQKAGIGPGDQQMSFF